MERNRIYYPQPAIPAALPKTISNNPVTTRAGSAFAASFQQVLQQEVSGLKFSQHALQRLKARNIQITSADMEKLGQAVDKAAQKGAQESLILMNQELALVVSVKNRTVITAMDSASMKDNVFTNIDSAIIV